MGSITYCVWYIMLAEKSIELINISKKIMLFIKMEGLTTSPFCVIIEVWKMK